MKVNNYKQEQLWLNSYFEDIDVIDFGLEAEIQMRKAGVCLPELLDVLANGFVEWAERDRDGCLFIITGRNCDDEEITISGGFNAGIEVVSVIDVEKAR